MSLPPSPPSPPSSSTPAPEAFAPERRRLCPDGACVGLIGADGRCRTCGLADPQGPPGLDAAAFAGGCATDDDRHDLASGSDEDDDQDEGGVLRAEATATGFDPARPLCPDGACLGVLEASGRCNVCGRLATEAAGA